MYHEKNVRTNKALLYVIDRATKASIVAIIWNKINFYVP